MKSQSLDVKGPRGSFYSLATNLRHPRQKKFFLLVSLFIYHPFCHFTIHGGKARGPSLPFSTFVPRG